ncbi:MAG TPA: DUF6194 family protein [Candidatus Limnocylindria bacterium]|nr:DUF6194 family protein [Candidatus Limnocylindria bacterium]
MTDERLPDGPTLDEMIKLLRRAFPDANVLQIDSAAFFSMDEKHWPNFATIVWTDEHDMGAPSRLSRDGVYRVNVGVDRATFQSLVGGVTDPDYAAFDTFIPHPVYARQRWIGILNPSHTTVSDRLLPLISASHDRLAPRKGA